MNKSKQDMTDWTMKVPMNVSTTGKKSAGRKSRPATRVQIYRDLAMALIGSSLDMQRPVAS